MSQKQEPIIAYKHIGETPLQCLERVRRERSIAAHVPMTYAGRLDPMAEGLLLLLVGDDCKSKDAYLSLDKEYEVEVLLGITTDTGDVLGVLEYDVDVPASKIDISKYIGKFEQTYPIYSSKTVAGKPLHQYPRENAIDGTAMPDELPTKEVEIYSIDLISSRTISALEASKEAIAHIRKLSMDADFRQVEIVEGWARLADRYPNIQLPVIKIRVTSSSGTYMRALAERIGADVRQKSMAYSIKRTKIGSYSV